MNFLRLQDDLISILFENDDILAINKPYGFNAHTNDSKIEHSDFIQDGLIEIFEKQLSRKLHIIHRLDQTTTGVMIFGKSVESAKKYAEFFFNRQVKKTYLFITKSRSEKDHYLIDKVIVHKAKDLEATTELQRLRRYKYFELWQANPLTGRNHQIRIHAEAAGISILGDPKYQGAEFPFLCLHNQRIEFPNGIVLTAEAPVYFNDLEILEDSNLALSLFQIDRRQRLFAGHSAEQAIRLIHNKNNPQVPGFTLDQLGPYLVLNWYFDHWSTVDVKRFTRISEHIQKSMIVKFLGKSHAAEQKNIFIPFNSLDASEQKLWTLQESKIHYEIRSEAGYSVGLFTNQRLQRQWILNSAKNKDVLSLFSHTGTASVAAALGGAKQVTSVETSKTNLGWSKKNFELNQLNPDQYRFFCRDSISFLQQGLNKKTQHDLIICDTPSFLRREKGFFKIETDLQELIINALQCLTPTGQLLLSTTFDGFFIDSVRQIILKSLNTLKLPAEINCLLPSLDFELPTEKTNLKSFLIQLKGSSS